MILKVEKRNLFEVDSSYYFAQCISADYALGAGIAVEFQKIFHLKQQLNNIGKHIFPDCILVNGVFNLVTKKLFWHKPTYESLESSLIIMKKFVIEYNITKIAMPKIGCHLDRLQWGRVKEIIEEVFKDTDIEILVCHL